MAALRLMAATGLYSANTISAIAESNSGDAMS